MSQSLDSIEELDHDTLTWNTLPEKLSVKRHWFGANALPRSIILAPSEICPDSYTYHAGDVPGWGAQLTSLTSVANIATCASHCDSNLRCCSFEYTARTKICNLNPECQPTAGVHKDFNFCVRGCGSIGFAIDNTGSGSSVITTAYGLVDALKSKGTEVSTWTLTTFNDVNAALGFEEIDSSNVKLITTTDNADTFRQSMTAITHSGEGDGPERATQGLLFTMQNMPPKGIAVVFTDHQTKNYNLESDINSLRTDKNLDVIVVLAPKYSGSANDASWQVYDRVSDGVFDMETSTLDQLVTEVSQRAEAKC